MKILIIGFLVFSGWTALSTYIYVCKIKGFCTEQVVINPENPSMVNVITPDTMPKPVIPAQEEIPKDLVMYFDFDKSDFSPNAETEKYFTESNPYLVKNAKSRLMITGHTDAVGSDEYNQALGYRRSQSMQLYFEKKGIPSDNILIESRGEKEPADNNNTTTGRANNRRAVITIKK